MQYADLLWDHDAKAHELYVANLAPIVLFTYNRLRHTQETVEALKKNVYAQDSSLFIYSDGPKTEADIPAVKNVREYLRKIHGFKEIHLIERKKNWGLARNIIDGVTQIVSIYGKIIVLEDDIVTSKYFLKYMNDALMVYKDIPQVMNVSAYMYPIKKMDLPETFFMHAGYCWGWATWREAWALFEREPEKLIHTFTEEEIYHFNLEGKADFWQQVIENASGKLYTWAVFWDIAIFKHNGFTFAPRDSLVFNGGMDGAGEHCSSTELYNTSIAEVAVSSFPLTIQESVLARERHRAFFERGNLALFPYLLVKIKRHIRKLLNKIICIGTFNRSGGR